MPDLEFAEVAVHLDARPVLMGIGLRAAAGEVLAVVGANGAGKSTLLRAALGLIPLAAGAIRLGGEDLARLAPRERARRLAYVPQRSRLAAPMPVRDLVATGRFPHRGPCANLTGVDTAAVDEALVQADAAHLAERPFTALSGGEQQRVLIARALAGGAPVLLLDEPTAGLDVAHVLRLIVLLRRLAEAGRTVVAALHPLDEVRQVADRIALLDRGRLADHGPAAAVLAGPALAAAFAVRVRPGGGLGFLPAVEP